MEEARIIHARNGLTHEIVSLSEDKQRLLNISVCTEGEALGHGDWLDPTFLRNLAVAGNKTKMKARFGHPNMCLDAIGTELGYFENFRTGKNERGNTYAVADMKFVVTDHNATQIDHIQKFAAQADWAIATSIVFSFLPEQCRRAHKSDLDPNFVPIEKHNELYDPVFEIPHLAELIAVDFVDEPAANPDGLFPALSAERESIIARWFTKAVKNPKIRETLQTIFSPLSPTNIPIPTKLISPAQADLTPSMLNISQRKSKAERLAKTGKLSEAEILGSPGTFFVWPDSVPQVGDDVFFRTAGVETDAQDGKHVLTNGYTVVTAGSILLSVEAPTQVPVSQSDANAEMLQLLRQQNDLLNQQLAAERKSQADELADFKRRIGNQPAVSAVPDMPTSEPNKGTDRRHWLGNHGPTDEAELKELAALYLNAIRKPKEHSRRRPNRSINPSARSYTPFNPAPLLDAANRDKSIMTDIAYYIDGYDGILEYARNITMQVPNGNTNLFNIRMPRLDFIMTADEFFQQDDPATCAEPPPSHSVLLSERSIDIHHLHTNTRFCSYDVRDAWNGLIFVDSQTIPAESVLRALMMDAAIRDIEKIFWYGRGNILGMLGQINLALCPVACIPPAQNPTTPAWSATTAISNTRLLLEAQPIHMRKRGDVELIGYPQLKQFYYDNYLAQNGYIYNDAARDVIPDWTGNQGGVAWATDFYELAGPPAIDAAILTIPSNLMYALEGAIDGAQEWYDINTDTINMRWKLWFGNNFMSCDHIVTDLVPVCP